MARRTAAEAQLVQAYEDLIPQIRDMVLAARARGAKGTAAVFEAQLFQVRKSLARLQGAETEFAANAIAGEYADGRFAAHLSIPPENRLQRELGAFSGYDRRALRSLQQRVSPQLTGIREALTVGLALGDPRLSTEKLLKALDTNGLVKIGANGLPTVLVPSGKYWKPEAYAKMLGRTAIADSRRVAFRQRYLQNGIDVVKIVANGTKHATCAAWEGVSCSLTGATPGLPTIDEARSAGLFHPNCRHRYVMDREAAQSAEIPRDLLGVPDPEPARPTLGFMPPRLPRPRGPLRPRTPRPSTATPPTPPPRPARAPFEGASSLAEAEAWGRENLVRDLSRGGVSFPTAPVKVANTIMQAASDAMEKLKLPRNRLAAFKWEPTRRRSLGLTWMAGEQGDGSYSTVFVTLQKTASKNAAKTGPKQHARYVASREQKIERLKHQIRVGEETGNLQQVEFGRNKLAQVEAAERWAAGAGDGIDDLRATVIHEFGHAAYYSGGWQRRWQEAVQKHGVTRLDMLRVGEYAASDIDELWAEASVWWTEGRLAELPASVQAAYREVIENV